jgi:NADPH-dependent 2,4-dienoyl-CoA reductase/sulfur reductase-like enzyme/rhodanese-related sulfurtransferase
MKYIIVGAVAGGASSAARLRRMDEHAEIVIFERGAYISYANCGLPYYIGNVISDRNKLFVQTATAFNSRFNIDVRVRTEVTSIDTANKTVSARNLLTNDEYTESYDKLILSPGAEPMRPPLPGINSEGIFTLRNVADTDYIKGYIDEKGAKSAVVIGAGFIGLEMAENLHGLGLGVTVIEMGGQVLAPVDAPMAAILQQHIRAQGVDLLLQTKVEGFERFDGQLRVLLAGGDVVETDLVILSIGVRPDSKLAVNAGLKTGRTGAIVVNEFLQTSDPDVYAVGDAIEFVNPITGQTMPTYLAGPANKQGRICADNVVLGNKHRYKGAINTAIVKVFEMTAGTTGMASKHLAAAGIEHIVSTTHSGSHAGYYPGAQQMTIQIAFANDSGKLLGAQVVGYDGVDKRLDVLAHIVQTGGTIHDLMEFEHAYAPPYSSAKDPVNMAGFVADNIMQQRLHIFYWNEVAQLPADAFLLDVRNPDEFHDGAISGAVNIPVNEMRSALSDLPRDRDIYIYCEAGLRGYLAQRILLQNGFNKVRNLSGGYRLWKACNNEKEIISQTNQKQTVS